IPLTSGFTGKFAVFQAAIEGGSTYLVIVGVVCSAIAAFFYARVVVLMFFQEPAVEGPIVVIPPPLTSAVLALTVTATVLLGVAPQLLLRVAGSADTFIR
ncbi:MAG: NADH-quinone oxidoreductase subunit, partial [Actinoplanes sp.]|nr:NADH-quinone oxidoreductase subunit [Actinoplanes sp.]